MVYAETQSEFQRVTRWKLILEEFGPSIHHIYGIDNLVADMISRLRSTTIDQYEPSTTIALSKANMLFKTREEFFLSTDTL